MTKKVVTSDELEWGPTGWNGSAAMRCTSTASSNECSPCYFVSKNCALQRSRADPFGKTGTNEILEH